ncbi:MAG: DUF177 domain-containing protein [Dehalococcoidales bacterium]|nr:DUF177 domain-containing protein [Dehalococcoidales bacterium]
MQTNVAQLLKSPIGSIRTLEVSSTLSYDDKQIPVKGEITLTRTHRSILAQGTLTASVRMTCSRCLKPFGSKIRLNVQEEYFPTIDIVTGEKMSSPEEEGSFTIDEHHVLDLTEAIRQYIVMALPMKPLCRENCAGLCSICGKDLNEGDCGCRETETDPRWAELLKLKKSKRK